MPLIDCQYCAFWDSEPGEQIGKCKRHPPVILEADRGWGKQPYTSAEDGCGDGELPG